MGSDSWRSFAGRIKWYLLGMFLSVMFAETCLVLSAGAVKPLVNAVAAVEKGQDPLVPAIIFLSLFFMARIFYRVFDLFEGRGISKLIRNTQQLFFDALILKPLSWFRTSSVDDTMTKVSQSTTTIATLTHAFAMEGVRALIMFFGASIIFWRESPVFTWVLWIWATIYVLVCYRMIHKAQDIAERLAEATALSNEKTGDILHNISQVVMGGGSSSEKNYIGQYYDAEEKIRREQNGYLVRLRLFQVTSNTALFFAMIALSIWYARQGKMSAGGFTMIYIFVTTMIAYVQMFVDFLYKAFDSLGTLKAGVRLLKDKNTEAVLLASPVFSAPAVEFKKVSFQHGTGRQIFDEFDFTVRQGERIAIIGLSGSGKTTLFNLMTRTENTQDGDIEINGQSVKSISRDNLASCFNVVSQSPTFFARTIRDNVLYGLTNDIEEENKRLELLVGQRPFNFIPYKEKGLDTVIRNNLSGGEKNRIAILRAMFRKAPILLLDEPTSALDLETEREANVLLLEMMKGRTTLLITHRLSLMPEMDRIIIIQRGKILAQGHHADLLAENLIYRRWFPPSASGGS